MVETVLGMTDLQIRLFTAFGQILVAAAVGSIAWRQWRTAQQQAETARKKLKYDMFDRRMKAYDALRDSAHHAITADWREGAEQKVFECVKELRWLFGKPIYDFVWEKVYTPLVDLWEANEIVHNTPPRAIGEEQAERQAARLNAIRLRKQLRADLATLEEMMSDFLTLNH